MGSILGRPRPALADSRIFRNSIILTHDGVKDRCSRSHFPAIPPGDHLDNEIHSGWIAEESHGERNLQPCWRIRFGIHGHTNRIKSPPVTKPSQGSNGVQTQNAKSLLPNLRPTSGRDRGHFCIYQTH
jgi:hypothetical protein